MDRLEKRFPRYSWLLKLYPQEYQVHYREQMLQTLADMLDDKENNRTGVWLRAAFDFPLSLVKENILFMGHTFARETPDYVKRSSLIGAVLLSPFFIFLTLDAFTSHSLYSSWFWQPWVVATWIVFMPALAFFICFGAFLRWSSQRKRQKKISFWHSIFDWRHNWPMAGVAVLSLGIIALAFGHDSVHCVVNNPIKEIRDWHTTWQCIKTG